MRVKEGKNEVVKFADWESKLYKFKVFFEQTIQNGRKISQKRGAE